MNTAQLELFTAAALQGLLVNHPLGGQNMDEIVARHAVNLAFETAKALDEISKVRR